MRRAETAGRPLPPGIVCGLLLAILAVAGALLAATAWRLDREMRSLLDAALLERAHALERGLLLHSSNDGELWHDAAHYLDLGTEFFGFYTADGRPLFQSERNSGRRLPLPASVGARPRSYDIGLPDGRAGRAVALPVRLPRSGAGNEAVLVVAHERESWEQAGARILLVLLAVAAVACALASLLLLGMSRART